MNGGRVFDVVFNDLKPLLKEINEHDPYTCLHSIQVAKIVEQYGNRIPLKESVMKTLIAAALLHDYGKKTVPNEILNKDGVPTKEEFEIIKKHPDATKQLLIGRIDDLGIPYLNERVLNIASHHHEKDCGGGYPNGIEHNDIEFEAQILHIADVFDAMASKRPYKDAFPADVLYGKIEGSEKDFDNPILKKFLIEVSLPRHAIICKESLDYMHKINPEYEPLEKTTIVNDEGIEVDISSLDQILNKMVRSDAALAIDNSTLCEYLSQNSLLEQLNKIEVKELCILRRKMQELIESDQPYIEVNPYGKSNKYMLDIAGFKFAFAKKDDIIPGDETFHSKALNRTCYGSQTGTVTRLNENVGTR